MLIISAERTSVSSCVRREALQEYELSYYYKESVNLENRQTQAEAISYLCTSTKLCRQYAPSPPTRLLLIKSFNTGFVCVCLSMGAPWIERAQMIIVISTTYESRRPLEADVIQKSNSFTNTRV